MNLLHPVVGVMVPRARRLENERATKHLFTTAPESIELFEMVQVAAVLR